MTILDTNTIYPARFKNATIVSKNGIKGRSGTTRLQRYRALNCELEVFSESGDLIGVIPWGIQVAQTSTHNCPLIRFFKSIGAFFDPTEFTPGTDLEGREVMIAVNNVCDNHWGLRTVVDQFFPANV
jgi:hypothetical protein